jgi:cytochrome c oxidase subunit I+III
MKTPLLFVYGFLFVFVLGGLTGVMVAFVPFDWQVHDSYFIVAHLHYVLFGGMVFPIFAAFYYWTPIATGRHLSERLGNWVFWLMFIGFNVAFLPMHLTGLTGLPRRVYTYPDQFGWDTLNLISSLGAYLLAAGILLFVVDLLLHRTRGVRAEANPWGAGTLEWLTLVPTRPWSIRSVPRVDGRYPLWHNTALYDRTRRGEYYLSDAPTLDRETLITHPITAEPEQVLRLPKNTWLPMVAAVATGAIFIAAIFKLYAISAIALAATTATILYWLWTNSAIPASRRIDAGGGLMLPLYRSGAGTHARLAMVVGMLIDATLFGSLLFTLVYLWTASPETWPDSILGLEIPTVVLGIILLVLSGASLRLAGRRLSAGRTWSFRALTGLGTVLSTATLLFLGSVMTSAEISPSEHAAGAAVWAIAGFHLIHLAALALAGLYLLARSLTGRLTRDYDADLKTVEVFWYYTTLQGITALLALYLLPV